MPKKPRRPKYLKTTYGKAEIWYPTKKEQKQLDEAAAEITAEIKADVAENPDCRPEGWPDPRLH